MPIIIDPPSGLPVPRRTDRAPRRGRKAIRIPGPGDIDQVPTGAARDPGLDVDPKAFGSGVGEAVADFGQAVGRLSSPVDRMNRRNDEAFAAAQLTALHERQTRAGLEARKDTSGGLPSPKRPALRTTSGGGSPGFAQAGVAGFHDGRMAAFDQDLGEVLKRAPSTVAREILKRQGGALRDLMSRDAARFEATARIVERRAAVDRELGNLSALARQDPDDHALHRALLENLLGAASNELPADKMAPFRAAEEQRLAEASVRGFIDRGDVLSARALLEAVGRDGPAGEAALLPPERVGALRKAIDRAADEAWRAERRAVDALMEDHLASLQTTGAGLGGVAERARAALDGKAFRAFERDEKAALDVHEIMESVKFAPPDVIDRELESRRPRKGARNFEDRQRRFEAIRRGAARMLKLRARDGAAFVMEMGDVKAAFEGTGADGPDLRRALKFRMAIQADIGMPEDRVRLLTRPEAGALADQVQSAATQDKAAKVAGLQDLYGPLFDRAMKELTQAGLNPRYRALAGARDNPVLARTIAEGIGAGRTELEKGLDPADVEKVHDGLREATADARSATKPGSDRAREFDAIVSAAGDLALQYLRETGDVEESAARTAAFANDAIEDVFLTAGEGGAEDDQLVGDTGDDELAMGAAREAAKAAATAVLREASKMGGVIRDKLRQLLGKKKVDQPPGGGAIAVETVVKVIRTKALERDDERAKVGKDPTTRKIELVPEDFARGANAEQVIEKIAEAQLSGAIKTNQPAVQLNLEDVGDVFAARVKKDTARLGRPVDVSGLRHAIDTQSITHAFSRHGPGNEQDPNSEPISPEVVSVYLDVVKNYDAITDARRVAGADRIRFEKRIDGLAAVVEEVRTAQGTLSFFTMWIEKR